MNTKKRGVVILITLSAIFLSVNLSIFLYNSAPIIEEITVLPETPYTDDNIRADIKIKDFDNKILQTHFIWYKNNENIFEETKNEQESDKYSYSILNNENFSKDDIILLDAYVSDGKKESKHKKINISIQNSPPQQPILIRPKDYTLTENNDVIFEYKAIDKDKDKIIYSLYINDVIERVTSAEKVVLNLKDGGYTWKIIASDSIEKSSSESYSLKIGKKETKKPIKKGSNKAPVLIRNIENQKWDVFGFKLNAFNLNNYFKDEDNDSLTFDTEGNSNITIFVTDDGKVSFLQPPEWYGTERVVFTASDGVETAKSNIVDLNIGEKKIRDESPCPGSCCNVDCGKITKNCSDGFTASCNMHCVDGTCVPCSPSCGDTYQAPAINLPVFVEGSILDGMPCIDLGITEEEKLVTIKDISLLKNKVPEGYSIIIDPFSLDCNGKMDVILNIPSNYGDIKALRCKGDMCYPTFLQHTAKLNCGGEITKRTLRQELYLEPELMPIKINEKSTNLKENITLQDEKIKISFHGDVKDAKATLRMPSGPIKEALNPNLKIVTTPIILRLEGSSSPDAKISLPYLTSKKIAEDSISFYVKKGEGWVHLGGTIDKENKIAEIDIKNIKQHTTEDNEILLTLMGVIFDDTFTSLFTKEYEPIQESKNMVVLIHGLASGPATFQELIDDIMLTNQPYHVYSLAYSSYRSVKETAQELDEYLELNSRQYNNIYIIAHSLGGLIAQKALYDAYTENEKDKTKYTFINKVRKAILASSTNEGSPVAEFYYELFDYLVNQDSPFALYKLNSAIIKDLTEGLIVPRVPTIKYYVIAGTQTYPFFERLSKLTGDVFNNQPNDGVITVKNAQHIGNSYLNKLCENYWEFNITHTETIDEERARKVILSIIAEGWLGNEEIAFMGNNQYLELEIDDCNKDDSFIVIGKKIKPQPAHEMFCGKCGDGYCSTKENVFNCPTDCINITKNKNFALYLIAIIGMVILTFLMPFLLKRVKKLKEEVKQKIKTKEQISNMQKNWDVNSTLVALRKTIQQLKKDYSDEELLKILITRGWKKELIEQFIKPEEKKKEFTYFGFED